MSACAISNFVHVETKHAVQPHYVEVMQKDGYVDEYQRDSVVEWLDNLNSKMKLSEQTFFLAINFLDRFLSVLRVKRQLLKLLAASCFMIACKVQEESEDQPTLSEFVRAGKYSYGAGDLLRMESVVCCKLKWEFSTVTPLDFLYQYMEAVDRVGTVPHVMRCKILQTATSYLKTVCIYDFLCYSASLKALCALMIALHMLLPQSQGKSSRDVLGPLERMVPLLPDCKTFAQCLDDMQYLLYTTGY